MFNIHLDEKQMFKYKLFLVNIGKQYKQSSKWPKKCGKITRFLYISHTRLYKQDGIMNL